MKKEVLNEREFELVNIIGSDLASNQRDLSKKMDLSLGMTNMLIRRLVSKGYIRISQLNKRKVQYLLTPKGFTEKMRKSVKYTLKTINSIGLIKENIKDVVKKLYDEGEKHFIVLGKSDFALLIEMTMRDEGFTDFKIEYVDSIDAVDTDAVQGTVLVCKEDVELDEKKFPKNVNLVRELAKHNSFVY